MNPIDLSIYLVTDSQQCIRAGRSLTETLQAAVAGGVTTIQIREKDTSARDFLDILQAAAQVVPAHISLLVNDRVDVYLGAKAIGIKVDGVHIGQSELPAQIVRQLIGPEAILGLSAGTNETLQAAQASQVVDYVGIGPLNGTTSKKDAAAPLGFAAIESLRRLTTLPAVAIGGISAKDLPALKKMGFQGAAVVSAICASDAPQHAAQQLADAWKQA